jgi:hypothetical protein
MFKVFTLPNQLDFPFPSFPDTEDFLLSASLCSNSHAISWVPNQFEDKSKELHEGSRVINVNVANAHQCTVWICLKIRHSMDQHGFVMRNMIKIDQARD